MLWGRKCWRTPDEAIREATASSPLRCRGIDYSTPRVDGGSDDLTELVDAHSRVLAILGQFDRKRQQVLVAYAHRLSISAIARQLGISRPTVRRWLVEDRVEFVRRMERQGLMCDGWAA